MWCAGRTRARAVTSIRSMHSRRSAGTASPSCCLRNEIILSKCKRNGPCRLVCPRAGNATNKISVRTTRSPSVCPGMPPLARGFPHHDERMPRVYVRCGFQDAAPAHNLPEIDLNGRRALPADFCDAQGEQRRQRSDQHSGGHRRDLRRCKSPAHAVGRATAAGGRRIHPRCSSLSNKVRAAMSLKTGLEQPFEDHQSQPENPTRELTNHR